MAGWSRPQVLALAPDAASAKAGAGQASPAKWPEAGASDAAAWGLCKGSGKNPYRVSCDLRDPAQPAFKCSCPSRKFPCKHAIGLMFRLADGDLPAGEPPDFTAEWMGSREQAAAKKAEKVEAKRTGSEKPADAAAAAKRAAAREAKVAGGVEELGRVLGDAIRQGLLAARAWEPSRWRTLEARMVDAQAPGLARRVRALSSAVAGGPGWESRFLREAGRVRLLLDGHARLADLPEALREEVRAQLGWTVAREELLADAGARRPGPWAVMAQRVDEEDRLRVLRTWAWSLTGHRPALLLEFAAAGQPLPPGPAVGRTLHAPLCFFPGLTPLRALAGEADPAVEGADDARPLGHAGVAAAVEAWRLRAAANPWLEGWPVLIDGVRIRRLTTGPDSAGCRIELADEAGDRLPVARSFDAGWAWLAAASGRPVSVFGELGGSGPGEALALRPLALLDAAGRHLAAPRDGGATPLLRAAG